MVLKINYLHEDRRDSPVLRRKNSACLGVEGISRGDNLLDDIDTCGSDISANVLSCDGNSLVVEIRGDVYTIDCDGKDCLTSGYEVPGERGKATEWVNLSIEQVPDTFEDDYYEVFSL